MPDAWTIFLLCLGYVIASPLMAWWVQKHHKGSMLHKVVLLIASPGCSVMLIVATPLIIPYFCLYFWLYRERHKTVMDVDGTETEKRALADYRSALRQETLWNRLLFRSGIRGASENRCAAENAVNRVWENYYERKEREKEEKLPHEK